MNSTILVTCGGTAGDIREQLGSRARVRKVKDGEAIGNYGDHVFQTSASDAALLEKRYPDFVRII